MSAPGLTARRELSFLAASPLRIFTGVTFDRFDHRSHAAYYQSHKSADHMSGGLGPFKPVSSTQMAGLPGKKTVIYRLKPERTNEVEFPMFASDSTVAICKGPTMHIIQQSDL
ncbi:MULTISPECIES: hypothetical protein [Rhizobium/Agrobacterium group]|uniref:hypothetical protein n=1 Tax=Rhizobium/Agrobacterium group TaxID=227290 RepID=UPI00115B46B5|nr:MULTISPECIES: hypothetical protein [Rhizobium/Agrobacterium group]NMV72520.1 hypothetical protein [Agrobacterium fabrum]NTI85415.1 hypothetical protein [Rhizobium rhizogenes]NTJ27598.1 hypothetical protein [Rhizobium rhizogenes]QRM41785.1 hypothetical protein F3X89_28515 [Rhizobium rhizogenes]QUE84848.1 hypothetical protein EML492_33290 [Rhizobium rhizogenes]